MIELKSYFSHTSGWAITQPGLQLSPRRLPFARFSRRFIGRFVARMVLILSGVLIGLLIRLFVVLLLWVLIVWHVLPPRRGARHGANQPHIGLFHDDHGRQTTAPASKAGRGAFGQPLGSNRIEPALQASADEMVPLQQPEVATP